MMPFTSRQRGAIMLHEKANKFNWRLGCVAAAVFFLSLLYIYSVFLRTIYHFRVGKAAIIVSDYKNNYSSLISRRKPPPE
jgi:hypothetical protein